MQRKIEKKQRSKEIDLEYVRRVYFKNKVCINTVKKYIFSPLTFKYMLRTHKPGVARERGRLQHQSFQRVHHFEHFCANPSPEAFCMVDVCS